MPGSLSRRDLLQAGALAGSAALFAVGCRSSVPEERAPVRVRVPDARPLVALVSAVPTIEGAGVHLKRSIGSRALPGLDPFLLLDDIHTDVPSEYVKGFPTHPHRGFETVTYMIEGSLEHRDSVGNRGQLVPGSAQWMTAGRGIIHSEMPLQPRGPLWGLQLWVNLPRSAKMVAPRYQDIGPESIPELGVQGTRTRLVAGSLGGDTGPVQGIAVNPLFLDVALPQRGRFEHELAVDHTAFAYVLDGVAELGPERREANAGSFAIFGPGRALLVRSAPGARLLLVSGRAWNEPVARRGPFVMNTEAELERAFADYRSGRLTDG